ncbi:hypothetical protein BWQ96_05121 [Gracilariopsis chorda]|uniref:Uncharacterized protein n=1 Tax=Gracilariopsis chorda TaxID=448386 RepID=A0A2V3ISJ6_9FLOR|nr:hypothetical protein BWQ96_05121 [Gracilariopsis chorda]|eukprot:PXF45082.1 hypothetical protein BWQ96_05121 [Gracilariopsis chorda]
MCSHIKKLRQCFQRYALQKRILPADIIGRGRIGSLFNTKNAYTGWRRILNYFSNPDIVLGRHDVIPDDYSGRIFCCVRAIVMHTRINACPQAKREDLIFMQNGHINPTPESTGVLSSCTRVVLYIGISTKDALETDGFTEHDPQGLTVACGKWAEQLKHRLAYHNLSCNIVDTDMFEMAYYEKIIWLCTFNLIGMYHGALHMSQVANDNTEEVTTIMHELFQVVQQRTTVCFDLSNSAQRLLSYSRTLTTFPTSFSEFETRNAYFYEHSKRMIAQGQQDPSPTHTSYVQVVFRDHLNQPIPEVSI